MNTHHVQDASGARISVGTRVRVAGWSPEAAEARKPQLPYEVNCGTVTLIDSDEGRVFVCVQYDMEDDGSTPGISEDYPAACDFHTDICTCADIEVIS